MEDYEVTIGIECHVQLATASKLFSSADNDARDAEPNSKVVPVDYGLPGMLPVLNKEAITLAIKAGKALNAEIAPVSRFDRKHYFYPDLPKGYQTSQMYQPIILAGAIDVPLEGGNQFRVRINHAHLEEDAGKLTHYADYSLVDLNRAGTPLIEIVSEPDIHSPAQARAYATELYKLMTYAGVTHGDLYHGNMRFDVNISVAKKGALELGKRTEVKNLNSFRSVEKAAEYEFNRQVALLEEGEQVVQETRGWNDDKEVTTSQRSKEDAQDYRYMPDADIPPIVLSREYIDEVQATMPPLPSEYREKLRPLELDSSVVDALLANQTYVHIVTSVPDKWGTKKARMIAHWFASSMPEQGLGADPIEIDMMPHSYVELARMVEDGELSSTGGKQVFAAMIGTNLLPGKVAEDLGVLQVSDESQVAAVVDQVMADPASQKALEDIRSGNDKAIGYLVGQVMKLSQGKANPGLAQKLIRERL